VPRLLSAFSACTLALLLTDVAVARPRTASVPSSDEPNSSQAAEYDVKAAYIFNLLPFTTWPPAAFESPTSPLTICVAQPDPFGSALKQTFQNEHVATHPVVVTTLTSGADLGGCHVVFIGAAADPGGALVQSASARPVLTIGEAPQFERRGGMITFLIEAGRVRFDVNQTSASKVGIQFSSKVLQVAKNIL